MAGDSDSDDRWVEGTLESGGDAAEGGASGGAGGGGAAGGGAAAGGAAGGGATPDLPNPETGIGIGAGEPSSFEPEEDPEAAAPAD